MNLGDMPCPFLLNWSTVGFLSVLLSSSMLISVPVFPLRGIHLPLRVLPCRIKTVAGNILFSAGVVSIPFFFFALLLVVGL